jgi:signal transduction histidine kinase
MLRVLGCITQQHDLRLVVLAGVLCLFACATAMSLVAHARNSQGKIKQRWLAGAGLVAGCGIWGTHFVAMLAYRPGFPVAYDPTLTALSVVIAVAMCGIGFALSLGRTGPAIGGAGTGAAIGTMHYVGMAAVRVPAMAVWDWRYVVASAAIGIAAMAGGMTVVTRGDNWKFHAAGAVIFTLAICSMHFTGMSAVTYLLDPAVSVPDAVLEPAALAVAVAAIAILIVALGLVGSLVNSHLSSRALAEAERLRAHVLDLEATKSRLEQTSESLKVALDAAAAANTAKSAFLAAMSHELRTPLNAVIGFSDLLLSDIAGPIGSASSRSYIQDIHASAQHLLALINDILDIASIDAGDRRLREEKVDPYRLLMDCMRMVSTQAAAARVSVSQDVETGLPHFFADRRRLKQILLNILGNAIKFSRAGGKVEARMRRAPGGSLEISIRDTGIGMTKEDIAVARERFGQVDSTLARKYEGAGLGLPIAIELMELHGGTLSIDSEENVGTMVTLTLPAARMIVPEPLAAA